MQLSKATQALLAVGVLSTCVKLLLMPAYRSTDFEVHRNWLAITHSLPMRDWYFENTSEWTLDYPPFFAFFEWSLAQIAQHVDPVMLEVDNLNYASAETVTFQRLSVMATDVVLLLAVLLFSHTWPSVTTTELGYSSGKVIVASVLVMFNPGLLIVDHIHFQYNGFLLGLLLLSVAMIRRGDEYGDVMGAALFAVLLMFKHIYAYTLPLYVVYLLRHYCFVPIKLGRSRSNSDVDSDYGDVDTSRRKQAGSRLRNRDSTDSVGKVALNEILVLQRHFSMRRLITLGGVTLSIVLLGLVPILFSHPDPIEAAKQMLSRLVPVQRGLCHAYWAPNIWALYNILDKALYFLLSKINPVFASNFATTASMTNGLVGVSPHILLPSVSPIVTLILSFLAMMPALVQVWQRPHPRVFLPALVYCNLCSFMFGYHVHEKAILMAVVPLTLSACDSAQDARVYLLMAWTAHCSLLPLLFTPDVQLLKVVLVVFHSVIAYVTLDVFHLEARKVRRIQVAPNGGGVYLCKLDLMYVTLLIGVCIYVEMGHPLLAASGAIFPRGAAFAQRYQFLPLMTMSVYCAVGLVITWVLALRQLNRKVKAVDTYQPSPRQTPQTIRQLPHPLSLEG